MKHTNRVYRTGSFLLVLCLLLAILPGFSAAAQDAQPIITYSGLTLYGGDWPTTDEDLPLLLANPEGKDFNFTPQADKMAAGECYFEYDYGTDVELSGLNVVGWWPAQQGISKVSFQYFDGSWKDSDQNVTVPWNASDSGPHERSITLTAPVVGSKFRVVVLATNTSWSTKCCMRLMQPVASVPSQSLERLQQGIAAAEAALEGAAIGSGVGQYPQAAADVFAEAIAQAKTAADSTLDEDGYTAALEALQGAQADFLASKLVPGKLPTPDIQLVNLSINNGQLAYLVDNYRSGSENFLQDIDLAPGGSPTNAYIVYDYMDIVSIHTIDLVGWFPKNQSFLNINVEYMQNGEWVPALENYAIDWQTPLGTRAEEALTITLDEPITASQMRIKVNRAGSTWGAGKMTMRLVEPRGFVVEERRSLVEKVRAAQRLVTGELLLGTAPGEFPQSAADTLESALAGITAQLEQPGLSSEAWAAIEQSLDAALNAFYAAQVPMAQGGTNPVVTLEGLTLLAGNTGNLIDRQYATSVQFEESGVLAQPGYIVFDFGDKTFNLTNFTLMTRQGDVNGPKNVDMEMFDGENWVGIGAGHGLTWYGNLQYCEGITIGATGTASKFRLRISETYDGGSGSALALVQLYGRFAVDTAALDEAVQAAEALLAEAEADATRADLLDILKIACTAATNGGTVANAGQEKIDALATRLLEAIQLYQDGIVTKTDLEDLYDLVKDADEALYTTGTWQTFSEALLAAAAVLEDSYAAQDDVDAALAALQAAADGLAYRATNTGALELILSKCQGKVEADYTAESWAPYAQALGEALAIIENPAAYTQTQVNQAGYALTAATSGLVYATDKSLLRDMVDRANTLLADEASYVPEAAAALRAVLERASALLADAGATQQQVNDMTAELLGAINGLHPLGDPARLQTLVDMMQSLQESSFTPTSWNRFAAVLGLANDMLANGAAEEEIGAMCDGLSEAFSGLEFRARKSSLETAIALAEDILANADGYVPSTLAGLREATDAGKLVLENGDATQAEVDAARQAISAILGGVRKRVDLTALTAALEAAGKVDRSLYTAASVSRLNAAVLQCEEVKAQAAQDPELPQEKADAALEELKSALLALEVLATTPPQEDTPAPEQPANQTPQTGGAAPAPTPSRPITTPRPGATAQTDSPAAPEADAVDLPTTPTAQPQAEADAEAAAPAEAEGTGEAAAALEPAQTPAAAPEAQAAKLPVGVIVLLAGAALAAFVFILIVVKRRKRREE